MFVHAGAKDPEGRPTDVEAKREFAFSRPGLPAGSVRFSENAIPIERPFTEDECPVKTSHLDELFQFVEGVRARPPEFCFQRRLPQLLSLCVLCQGYLAVHAAANKLGPDLSGLLDAIGWNGLPENIRGMLTVDGPRRMEEVRSYHWWLAALVGSPDDAQWPALWERFRVGLHSELGLKKGDPFPHELRSVQALLDRIGESKPIEDLSLVADVYRSIAARIKNA
jgi:hypothetical protein